MRGLQIVKNFPQKQHTLPAHVLLNASEDLLWSKKVQISKYLKITKNTGDKYAILNTPF